MAGGATETTNAAALVARSMQLLDALVSSVGSVNAQGLTACLSLANDAGITVSATSVLTMLGQPVTISTLVQARALQLHCYIWQ